MDLPNGVSKSPIFLSEARSEIRQFPFAALCDKLSLVRTEIAISEQGGTTHLRDDARAIVFGFGNLVEGS